ncbi:MAG: hypothetical protein HN764_08250, partial [Gammaproteobacteria bacterium]|nr:hypothetical protein [Gammaproteobacteria bacterium]
MKDDKDTQTVNLQLTPAYDQRDEISLYDICCIFIKYKLHIIAATLFFTIASLVYAFVVSPVYEAVAYLAPPNERDIAGLNIFYLDIEGLSIPTSPEKVFNKYLMNFYSRSIRRQYFDTNNLLEKLANKNAGNVNEEKVFENSFNNLLSFRKSDEDKNIILPQLMAKEAEHASLWLNEFIYFVDTETVSSLKKDVKKVIALKKQSINDNIILVREHAKKKRFDEIQRLSEKDDINSRTIENKITALKNKSRKELKDGILVLEESNNIAKKLGIGGPISFAAGNKSTESSDLLINLGDMPGYTRGFEALSAELEFLKDRKNKDS